MKGVIFTGGEGPPPALCKTLAEDAALVVAADSGLLLAAAADITPDWIVGDMDSLPCPAVLDRYPAERVLRCSIGKDDTDTELACRLLAEKGCASYTLIGGGGGRLAHLAALFALFERPFPPSRWRTAYEEVFFISNDVQFELDCGAVLSLFPAGEGPWQIASENLKWPLENVAWKRGAISLSNVAQSSLINLFILRGTFLVVIEATGYTVKMYPLQNRKDRADNSVRSKI